MGLSGRATRLRRTDATKRIRQPVRFLSLRDPGNK